MVAGFPDLKSLKVPESSDVIVGGQPTETLMHFFNDLVGVVEALRSYQEPEIEIPPQVLIQEQYTASGAIDTTNDNIPFDNTIPQSNEGTSLQTLSFTPTEDDSKIVLEWTGSVSGQVDVILALFISGTTDALDSAVVFPAHPTIAASQRITLRAVLDSWGTTAKTVTVRFGSDDPTHSNTVYVGSTVNGTSKMGGTMMSTLSAREYKNPT